MDRMKLAFIIKPMMLLMLTVALYVIGFCIENVFFSIVMYTVAAFSFNHWYKVTEVHRALYAYMHDEEYQIGFTIRHGFGRLCFHLLVVMLIFVLVAVFFETVRMQSIFFALLALLGLSMILGMRSIDFRLQKGFELFVQEQEELKKKHEEHQKLLEDLEKGMK